MTQKATVMIEQEQILCSRKNPDIGFVLGANKVQMLTKYKPRAHKTLWVYKNGECSMESRECYCYIEILEVEFYQIICKLEFG